MLVFFLSRVGLLLFHLPDFHDLTPVEILQAFTRGLMFDASIIVLVSGVPLLMMLVPFVFVHHPHRLRFSTWVRANVAVIALVALLAFLGHYYLVGRLATIVPYAVIGFGAVTILMLLPFRFTHHRAWMNFWKAAGSLTSSGVALIAPTLARAFVTSMSTFSSWAA